MQKSSSRHLVIETARLRLFQFTLDDAPFFMALTNDKDWLRFIGDKNIHRVQAARDYLEKLYLPMYAANGFGFYLVELKTVENEAAKAIGMCGLIKREGLSAADIGFAYLPAFRHQGYAHEAAAAILNYARDTLMMCRVLGIVTPENRASIALLEKCGFTFDGETTLPNKEPQPVQQLNRYALNLRPALLV